MVASKPKNNTGSTLRSRKLAVDPLHPPVKDVLEFLQELYERGLGFSCLNTARSALSPFLVLDVNVTVGNHQRFLKGIFQTRPAAVLKAASWSCESVFNTF